MRTRLRRVEAGADIERYCAGPRLELFSRESRPGWDAWGLETGKFDPAREIIAAE